MKLVNKTDIYEYDLSSLDAMLTVDIPASQYKVEIIFKNGEFVEAKYLFTSPYSDQQWRILGLINDKIQELKKSYKKSENY